VLAFLLPVARAMSHQVELIQIVMGVPSLAFRASPVTATLTP
jgi:hypothetical protein